MFPLPQLYVMGTCKLHQGLKQCRFLSWSGKSHYCLKTRPLEQQIIQTEAEAFIERFKTNDKNMEDFSVAIGDNCGGF